MKVCNVCHIEKDLTKFRIRKNGDYRHQCKSCEGEYQKKRKTLLKPIVKKQRDSRISDKHNKVINQYIGKECGSFVVIKYEGYYPEVNSKYSRYHFTKKCKFCNHTSIQNKNRIDQCCNNNSICNRCQETYNVNTNQKKCSICNIWLDSNETNFNKSKNRPMGLHYYCRKCQTKRSHKFRESDENRKKEYIQKQERSKNDPLFKFTCRVRTLIKCYINRVNIVKMRKKCKTVDILGCNFYEFKEYIEKQFVDGMSWDNYGAWHLDHIVPVSLGVNEDEVIELCHHTNYQPLWAAENLSKNNKILLDKIPDELVVRFAKFLDRSTKHKKSPIS